MQNRGRHIIDQIPEQAPIYIALLLGAAAVGYATLKLGYIGGLALGMVPLALVALAVAIQNPYWAYTALFVVNYFIMGIVRYFPSIPVGVILDSLIMFNLFTLLIRACYKKVEWGRAVNGMTIAALVWLVFCFLQLFNPQTQSAMAWLTSIRSYAIYFFFISIFTPIIFYRYRDLKRILMIWSVLTLLAVLKSVIQRTYGFDSAELDWLFVRGGASTHIIFSGVRYFSFFRDAANFGASMGFSMVVFSIAALFYKNRWLKYYMLAVAAAACYGMMISGTRSALAVPFAGYALFVILARQTKMILGGMILLIGAFVFLNYTTIGQGNALIRRARSTFDFNDPSFQVRLKNQRLIRTYMADKPLGAGLGHGGGKAKEFAPDAYLSQIPTDSWFVMVWVETGIVGLILHIGILCYILGYGMWLTMFRLKNKQLRGFTGALTAGIFGMMVASYSNEILGQFPNGVIIYMSMAFIFLAPRFERELEGKPDMPQVDKLLSEHES